MVGSQIYLLLPCLDAYNILYVCFLPVITILLNRLNKTGRQSKAAPAIAAPWLCGRATPFKMKARTANKSSYGITAVPSPS